KSTAWSGSSSNTRNRAQARDRRFGNQHRHHSPQRAHVRHDGANGLCARASHRAETRAAIGPWSNRSRVHEVLDQGPIFVFGPCGFEETSTRKTSACTGDVRAFPRANLEACCIEQPLVVTLADGETRARSELCEDAIPEVEHAQHRRLVL